MLSLLLLSCNNKNDTWIEGRIFLVQMDGIKEQVLSYKLQNGDYVGIVEGPFLTILSDGKFLLVKKLLNKNEMYYIIPLLDRSDYNCIRNKIGPLDLDSLNKQMKYLKINGNNLETK